jgi:hypothetical protein
VTRDQKLTPRRILEHDPRAKISRVSGGGGGVVFGARVTRAPTIEVSADPLLAPRERARDPIPRVAGRTVSGPAHRQTHLGHEERFQVLKRATDEFTARGFLVSVDRENAH